MIQKLFLLFSVSTIGAGYWYLKKKNLLTKIFEETQNLNNYNVAYVNQLKDLPVNKLILLAGTVQPNDYVLKTLNNKQSILNTYIKINNQQDRLWKSKQSFRFIFTNQINQRIIIQNKSDSIYLYNLKKSSEIDHKYKKLNLNWMQNIVSSLLKTKYEQRCIYTDNIIVLIGKLQNVNNQYRLQPKYMLGENKESFLKYLDEKIVKYQKRYKGLITIGSILMLSHLIYKNIYRPKEQLPKI